MMERSQRPLIDRPRYISKPPKVAKAKPNNKPVNKEDLNKRQLKRPNKRVINKQVQPPVSGSAVKIDEAVKAGADAVKLQTIDPDENYLTNTSSYKIFKRSYLYNV